MGEIEDRRSGSLERVSDADREATLDFLRGHCSVGVLSLDEFSNRASKAVDAVTRADLDVLIEDLPTPEPPTRDDLGVKRVVAFVGSNRRRGKWRVGRRASAVAVAGTSWIDLRHAQLAEGELTVRAFALCGTVKVVVPKGIGVELTGVSLVGAQTDGTDARDLLPGAPVIRVKAVPVLGSVRIISATSLRMRTLDRVEGRVKD